MIFTYIYIYIFFFSDTVFRSLLLSIHQQIFPQIRVSSWWEFWSRLPRQGKQVYCPRVLKATEDEASWAKDLVEFWALKMVSLGREMGPRLQGNLGEGGNSSDFSGKFR